MNKEFLADSKGFIEAAYLEVTNRLPFVLEKIDKELKKEEPRVALAVKYLYAMMPVSDVINYPLETYLDYARHGVEIYDAYERVQRLDEETYLNYVLFHRVNEEEIATCRSLFHSEMKARISGMNEMAAAQEVNFWCAEHVAYQASDNRTSSAIAVYQKGTGRCGEESVFVVNALRSVGIPARQVYAPRWSHTDDNHAWVEICQDNVWYFMGACEPEPVLNRGWFTNAASRAMMVHSRWFDVRRPQAGIIGTEDVAVMLNELPRYADTVEITVEVLDEDSLPMKHQPVTFEVLNFSEFAGIAEGSTNEAGKIRLTTGLGNLQLFVKAGDAFAVKIIDTGQSNMWRIHLKEDAPVFDTWEICDMKVPRDTNRQSSKWLSKEQLEKHQIKLAEAVRMQGERASSFVNANLERFRNEANGQLSGEYKEGLIRSISKKDQSDITYEVLMDAAIHARPYFGTCPDDVFFAYLLNPRVEDEVLAPHRAGLQKLLGTVLGRQFWENPKEIYSYVCKQIKEIPEKERRTVRTKPFEALKSGLGTAVSKRILAVAIARSLGIPARINEEDGTLEYYWDGKFELMEEGAEKNGKLVLDPGNIRDYDYFYNITLGKLATSGFVSLNLKQRDIGQKTEVMLAAGIYRIVTANRMPNGNLLACSYYFQIEKDETKVIALKQRHGQLSDMLFQIPMDDFGLKNEQGKTILASTQSNGKKHAFFWLMAGTEPTEHILNEIIEKKENYQKLTSQMTFILRAKKDLENPTLAKVLRELPDILVLYDDSEAVVERLGRDMYIDFEKRPFIIVTNKEMKGIYGTSGYQVGTGNLLLKLL